MADFSMSDMPWLGQPADPAGSLARGIQAGSMLAQTRNQRDALALRRMEFEEQQRERAAMLPLEMALKGQESQMKALLIEKMLKDRQQEIKNTQDLMALEDTFTKSFSETDDPVGTMRMLSIEALNKNPHLGVDPRFKALSDEIGNIAQETERMMRAEAYRNQRSDATSLGNVTIVTDPQTGKKATYVRESANSISQFPNSEPEFNPRVVTVTDTATGKPITLIQTGPKSFREPRGEGEVIEFTSPTGEKTSITRGGSQKTQGELTTATQTRLQEQSSINTEAITMLQDAISGIRATPSAIGVRGKVGTIVEQAKGQLQPNTPLDTPITDVRQKASIAFSRVAPALRIDSGNMSRYELNKLEQAGDVLGIEEAPQTAERKLLNLQSVVIGRQLRLLKTQGKPVPDEILKAVQGEEIAALIQAGLLTKEEASRLYQLSKQNGR